MCGSPGVGFPPATPTRASVVSWDQYGGYPLTAQMVSGVQAA